MPIELDWISEGRVIGHYNVGDVSEEDMLGIDEPIQAMLDEAKSHLAHVIVFTNPDGDAPFSIRVFTDIVWARHERLGWTVAVGITHPVLRFVVYTASKVFDMRHRFVDTAEEAIEFLHYVDPTLPDDSTWNIRLAEYDLSY